MFYTYILANQVQGALFIGACDNLHKRVSEHKITRHTGRTAAYTIDRLVWFEAHVTRKEAMERQREIKSWSRDWRLALLQKSNPNWDDLSSDLSGNPISMIACSRSATARSGAIQARRKPILAMAS